MNVRVISSVLIVGAVLLVAGCAAGAARPGSTGTATSAPTSPSPGFTTVGPVDLQPTPLPEELAMAWYRAYQLAEANPTDFGYPWADGSTRQLAISVATDHGAELAQGLDLSAVAPVIRRVDRTFRQLETLKDSVIDMVRSDVSDADAIVATGPDYAGNRIIVTITRPSEPLLAQLARRFGTEALAVRVDSTYKAPQPY